MTFDEYEEQARKTNICPAVPGMEHVPVYEGLAMAGEAGEFANKVKKVWRDLGPENFKTSGDLAAELGDVLWYVSAAASRLGYGLDEIATLNIIKLESRHARGTVQGSGDHR